jgi:hypothetical protein
MGGFSRKLKKRTIALKAAQKAAEAAAQKAAEPAPLFEEITRIFQKLGELEPDALETKVDELNEWKKFFSGDDTVGVCKSEAPEVVGEIEEPEYLEASELPPWIKEEDDHNKRASKRPRTVSVESFLIWD